MLFPGVEGPPQWGGGEQAVSAPSFAQRPDLAGERLQLEQLHLAVRRDAGRGWLPACVRSACPGGREGNAHAALVLRIALALQQPGRFHALEQRCERAYPGSGARPARLRWGRPAPRHPASPGTAGGSGADGVQQRLCRVWSSPARPNTAQSTTGDPGAGRQGWGWWAGRALAWVEVLRAINSG